MIPENSKVTLQTSSQCSVSAKHALRPPKHALWQSSAPSHPGPSVPCAPGSPARHTSAAPAVGGCGMPARSSSGALFNASNDGVPLAIDIKMCTGPETLHKRANSSQESQIAQVRLKGLRDWFQHGIRAGFCTNAQIPARSDKSRK